MSSSSSSECLYDDCFQYGVGHHKTRSTIMPIFQTLDHPLIYYAQLQPQQFNCRSREFRKTNPNCFVKAFRWYTQEHLSKKDVSSRINELSSFAEWLDKKYDEFLQSKQVPDCCQGYTKQTYPFEADNMNINVLYESPRKNMFARMKSPWRKKKRHSRTEERDSTFEKCSQSLEYILKPKNLSRPASACCNPRLLGNQLKFSSSATEVYTSNKSIIKTCCPDKNVTENANYLANEINKNERVSIHCPSSPVKPDIKAIQYVNQPEASHNTIMLTKNISCQFPKKRIVNTNVETQYHESDSKSCAFQCSKYTVPMNTSTEPLEVRQINKQSKGTRDTTRKVTNKTKLMRDISCECPTMEFKVDNQTQCLKNDTVSCTAGCTSRTENKTLHSNQINKQSEGTRDTTRKVTNKTKLKTDISCECPTMEFKVDNQTQYEKYDTVCSTVGCSKRTEDKSLHYNQPNEQSIPCFGNCSLKQSDGHHRNTGSNIFEQPTNTEVFMKSSNDYVVQTSDRAISLEDAGFCQYPFFMKIICADKLKDELADR